MDYRLNVERVDAELEKLAAQPRFQDRWQDPDDEDPCEAGALWAAVNSLLDSLEATCAGLDGLDQLHSLHERCQAQTAIVRELDEILKLYAKHTDTAEDGAPQIDPMLVDWVSDCATIVADLRKEAEKEVQKEKDLEDWDVVSVDDGVESIADTETLVDDAGEDGATTKLVEMLEAHCVRIKDFLPIMRCDIDDFISQQISPRIPQARTPPVLYRGATEHAHHLQYMRDLESETSSSATRSTLYDLSDTMKNVQAHLKKYESSLEGYGSPDPQPSDDSYQIRQLIEQNDRIIGAISEAQTNHGSEWIDNMLNGKLTYAEYKSLSVAKLRDLRSSYEWHGFKAVDKNVCVKDDLEQLKKNGFQLECMLKIPA